MKKIFVAFTLSAALFLVFGCSDKDNEETAQFDQTEECSYNDYKCDNGNSYWCGDYGWNLFQTCTRGCDSETGKCMKNSDNKETDDSDKGPAETNDSDTKQDENSDNTAVPDSDLGNNDDTDETDDDNSDEPDDADKPDDADNSEGGNADTEPENDYDYDNDTDVPLPDEDADADNPENGGDSENPDSDEDTDSGETVNDGRISLGELCTGQTSCYNASAEMTTCPASSSADFYGQDAQYADRCTPQSLTVETISGDSVAADNNTGLMWQQTISTSRTYTWANAQTYCSGSTYAGRSGWRLPTPQEILTIVDNSRQAPALDKTLFPNMPKSDTAYLWTSKAQGTTSNAIAFNPYRGSTYYVSKTAEHYVMCVYGEELPEGSFSTVPTESSEKVVVDSSTGLMWQKNYASKTWQDAFPYCENLNYAGYDDWRLPNKNELASLLNLDKTEAPYSTFPDMPKNRFWSSSTRAGSDFKSAWVVMFAEGYVSGVEKTASYSVRCVR